MNNNPKYKAIETIHSGFRFRSRLEARWAVFFEHLQIPYEYEREGYDLDGLWYLPDFWLPQQDCWIEIKGESIDKRSGEEIIKTERLALATQKRVFVFENGDFFSPTIMPLRGMWACGLIPDKKGGWIDRDDDVWYTWIECPACRKLEIDFWGHHTRDCIIPSKESKDQSKSPRLIAAYEAARQARF